MRFAVFFLASALFMSARGASPAKGGKRTSVPIPTPLADILKNLKTGKDQNKLGYIGEGCGDDFDCASGRYCDSISNAVPCENFYDDCICLPGDLDDLFCDCDDACDSGELCDEDGYCISAALSFSLLDCSPSSTPTPTPSPTPVTTTTTTTTQPVSPPPTGPVTGPSAPATAPPPVVPPPCIDVKLLTGFEQHELRFDKHVMSPVLCDSNGSCATRGHIVHYKGRAMMMRSYCDIVGCSEDVMEVNSPKYRRGLRVHSKSDDMLFTAFSARYETRSEEAILSTVVHMGL